MRKARAKLEPDDRHFLSLVAKAIFTNPFSDEYAEIYSLAGPEQDSDAHRLNSIVPLLNERLQKLEARGQTTVQSFTGKDRTLVENAFLFQAYHACVDDFDELIQAQLRLGEAPAPVPFADRVFLQLKARGFTEEDCARYFALFYQLRRAYYFIVRSLVGDSPSMKDLRLALWNSVFTHDVRIYEGHLWNRMEDFSTLILGETGTGKGASAAAIGRSGFIPFDPRRKRFAESFTESFVTINLSQYPESLIESELFGHRKGAFTGAVEDYEGLFERCSPHGALFLDEIGDVSVPIQIKLLQVLESRTFAPVGSHVRKRFSGRVIAATNRSIQDLRQGGRFRDDFFYRLCSDVIVVPPLRKRIREDPSELSRLVDLTVARLTGQASPELARTILATLSRDLPAGYGWPGNVRELEQASRRILLTRHYGGDRMAAAPDPAAALARDIRAGALEARDLLGRYCVLLYRRLGTYEEVARRTGLDRRTVKKHVDDYEAAHPDRGG